MTSVDRHFTDTLGQILYASQIPRLWTSIKEFAGHFGYTHLAGADAQRLAAGASDAMLYTDAPQVPLHFDLAYPFNYTAVPFVQRALTSPEPFLISDLRRDPKHEGPWQEIMADVIKRGDGLVVPVFDHAKPVASFMFGGENPNTSALTRALLQVLAHAAFARYRMLGVADAAARPTLSMREVQCLRALADGKTDNETARDLGISTRTVRFHIDAAKVKLGVATRVQAVAKVLHDKIVLSFTYCVMSPTFTQTEAALAHLAYL